MNEVEEIVSSIINGINESLKDIKDIKKDITETENKLNELVKQTLFEGEPVEILEE